MGISVAVAVFCHHLKRYSVTNIDMVLNVPRFNGYTTNSHQLCNRYGLSNTKVIEKQDEG